MTTTDFIGILSLLVSIAFGATTTWLLVSRRLPVSHRVAILGFPQTGKTTLITALFDYLLRHGARGKSIIPRGDETIRRLNDNLRALELQRSVKPTTDQDVFAYRAEVVSTGVFQRRYKLEIGDFPGEDTVAFSEQYGDWLHETPYFQWAISADAFIFVVDVSSVLKDGSGELIAREKSAFRAAWQHLREHHLDGTSDVSKKLLLLVFTKADLLSIPNTHLDSELLNDAVKSKRPFYREKFKGDELDTEITQIRERFSDLIDYFQLESARFDVLFTSAIVKVNNERLGIPELARRILPHLALFGLPNVQELRRIYPVK